MAKRTVLSKGSPRKDASRIGGNVTANAGKQELEALRALVRLALQTYEVDGVPRTSRALIQDALRCSAVDVEMLGADIDVDDAVFARLRIQRRTELALELGAYLDAHGYPESVGEREVREAHEAEIARVGAP